MGHVLISELQKELGISRKEMIAIIDDIYAGKYGEGFEFISSRDAKNRYLKPNTAESKNREWKFASVIRHTETTQEQPKPDLSKSQQLVSSQLKKSLEQRQTHDPAAFEKSLDKLADKVGNITVRARKTGTTVTFNIDNVDNGQRINIKSTPTGYEIDGNSYENNATAMDAVLSLLNDTDTRFKKIDADMADAGNVGYAIRKSAPPKNKGKMYKAFRLVNGLLYPMFVGAADPLPTGIWIDATEGGYHFTAKNGRDYVPADTGVMVEIPDSKTKAELFKRGYISSMDTKQVKVVSYRPGWHGADLPFFPQSGTKIDAYNKRNGTNISSPYPNMHKPNTVMVEVEYDADKNYKQEYIDTAERSKKTGEIVKTLSGIRHVPEGGYYEYPTNPILQNREDVGKWFISGSIKIGRILSKEEANSILDANNVPRQMWEDDTRHKSISASEAEAQRQMDEVRAKYEGTDQWMKAPNGKPSKLNERQWVQVRTPNFIKWFGDWLNDPKNASKVVDENGEPMVVYHGTTNENFTMFDLLKAGTKTDAGYFGTGLYFTPSHGSGHTWAGTAGGYAYGDGGRIYPLFLNIKNPKYQNQYNWSPMAKNNHMAITVKNIADGYDGVIVWKSNLLDQAVDPKIIDEIVAYSPAQIKSATANTGEFSKENPDIRHSPIVDFQTAEMIYRDSPNDIEGMVMALTSVIPKRWISHIETEGDSARITFVNGREVLISALTGAITDGNGKPIAVGSTMINRRVGSENNVIAIINIAKNYNNGNMTAFHEGFHLAFNLMLSEKEQRIVLQHYSGRNPSSLTQAERIAAEEKAALDFEYIIKYGKPPLANPQVQGILTRLWQSIRSFVKKAMGKDFYKANFQILERIRTGELEDFNYNARDYFNNPKDEALYRKIKDPLEGLEVTTIELNKAAKKITNMQDRGLDMSRKLSLFMWKVAVVYNQTGSETKRELLIKKFADYLELTLPHMPGFTKNEIATLVRNVNKIKTIKSLGRKLYEIEAKLNKRYGQKLYPEIVKMVTKSTKIAKQKDTLARKRLVSDDVLEKLQYIKSIIAMNHDESLAELIRLSTLNEEAGSETNGDMDTASEADEWERRYFEMFSELKQTGKNKDGGDTTVYSGVERMAVAYEEVRSLITEGKSIMRDFDEKRKAEHKRKVAMTLLALMGGKSFKDGGLETKLEKHSKSKSLNPIKKIGNKIDNAAQHGLFMDSIFADLDINAIHNNEAMREYRKAKEAQYNEAIANEEDAEKIKLMEFNRDQHLSAIDEVIEETKEYKGMLKGWFQENYFDPIYDAYRKRDAGLVYFTKLVHNMRTEIAKEIFGIGGIADYLPAIASSTLNNTKISLLDPQSGKRVSTRISLQALGSMYAYSLNPAYAENVLNTGFDEIAMREMMDIFAKSKAGRYMQRWVEKATYEFYPLYFQTINDAYIERNAFGLTREMIYTPAIMDVKNKLMEIEIGNPKFAATENFTMSLGAHISRISNNVGFKLDALNFDAQLTNHIHMNEHYKALVMPIYNARTTILTKPVLAAIDTVMGEAKRRALTSYYRDIAANGYVKQDVSNGINRWTSNISMALLSFSPKVGLKQVSSLAYAAAYMTPAELTQHLGWAVSHPVEMAKLIRKSPSFQVRYKEGITSDQYMFLHMGNSASIERVMRQMLNQTGNWSKYGDQAAVLFGGGAIYHKEYVELQAKHPDWTDAQLEDGALRQMELFVDRTQQSAKPPFVPQMRREGTFWRLATQFKTQKFAAFNALYNAASSSKVNPDKDQLAWMLVVLLMLQPVLEWVGNIGFTKPGSVWDIYLGGMEQILETIPILGEIASAMMLWAVKGDVPEYDRLVPALGGIRMLNEGTKQIDRAIKRYKRTGEVELKPILEALAKINVPLTGVPLYPILQLAKGWDDYISGEDRRIARLFGYSEGALNYAEKTYGEKKK
jgi:hypothetical protein